MRATGLAAGDSLRGDAMVAILGAGEGRRGSRCGIYILYAVDLMVSSSIHCGVKKVPSR